MQDQIQKLLEDKKNLDDKLIFMLHPNDSFKFVKPLSISYQTDGLNIAGLIFGFDEIERLKAFLTQFDKPKKRIANDTGNKAELEIDGEIPIIPKRKKKTSWSARKIMEAEIRTLWQEIIKSGDPSILKGRSMQDFKQSFAHIMGKQKSLVLHKLKHSQLKPMIEQLNHVKLK